MQEGEIEFEPVNVDNGGAGFVEGDPHGGVIQWDRGRASVASAAGNDGDFAGVRGAGAGFGVGALAFGAAVAGLEDVAGFPSLAFTVMSVDKVGAFVIMRMTGENKINSTSLKNG